MKTIKPVNTSKIEAKIKALEAQIAAATPEQIAQSEKDAERLSEILSDIETVGQHREEFLNLDTSLSDAAMMLKDYEATLNADLVKIETDYVISSDDLISPAGFHPDEKVFIQPRICIQTNDPKFKPPHSNLELKLYNLR